MALTDPDLQFDLRTVHRYIKAGRVEKSAYEQYLESLPDVSDHIMDREEGGDDDGYEESLSGPSAAEASDPFAEAPAAAPVAAPVAAPAPPAVGGTASPPGLDGAFAPPPMEVPIKD